MCFKNLFHYFSVFLKNNYQDETISLDNEENLVAQGLIVQKFSIPDDSKHIQRLNVNYIADKDGYKANYTLIKEEASYKDRLSPLTLKSVAG